MSTPSTASSANLRWLVSDTIVHARRRASHIRQIPEKLLDVTLQPIMFVMLFAYVFGGAISVPGSNYREYLIGGILVQTLAFGMMSPGMSIAADLSEGVIDRFRSLPSSRSAYLLGHLLTEFASSTLALVIMTISGLIIGWRIHTDATHALAGFALLLLFAFCMQWLGTLIGLTVRSSDSVQGVAFMVIFPLTFIANTFVPLETLPGVLQEFAEYNPVSTMSAAARELFGNAVATPADAPWTLRHPVAASVIGCLAMLAILVPLTLRRYNARTRG